MLTFLNYLNSTILNLRWEAKIKTRAPQIISLLSFCSCLNVFAGVSCRKVRKTQHQLSTHNKRSTHPFYSSISIDKLQIITQTELSITIHIIWYQRQIHWIKCSRDQQKMGKKWASCMQYICRSSWYHSFCWLPTIESI